MRKHIIFIFIVSSYLLSGCSTVASSIHYTNGTQCLERGDYSTSVNELEMAVELDPSRARNYTNLSAAYIAIGDGEKSWYCCRQAVRCPYDDGGICRMAFAPHYRARIAEPGLNKIGTSWEDIHKNLGDPDEYQEDANGQISSCTYGVFDMFFSDGKLTGSSFRKRS
jgi:tetratricopeptide (TPR) repeat protein